MKSKKDYSVYTRWIGHSADKHMINVEIVHADKTFSAMAADVSIDIAQDLALAKAKTLAGLED